MIVAHVVHDLSDPAVARRVAMLQAGGASVRLAGFRRGETAPKEVSGVPALDLGRTRDAALIRRALAVAGVAAVPGRLAAHVADADVLMARNLESLILAARVAGDRPLVYECLDIHASLLGARPHHRLVQAIEARLLARVRLLVTSSPAFAEAHFAKRPTLRAPTLLVENKLLRLGSGGVAAWPRTHAAPPPGPPWTIGWLGMLRCRRSFALLCDLAARMEGKVEVLIAGRPSPAVLPDLAERAAAAPHVTFLGAYTPETLGDIYARCHFAWAVDWFEEGQNSLWLLPNRLYEATAFDVTPIALKGVETGRWLAAHGAGLLIADDAHDLPARMAAMDAQAHAALRAATRAVPRAHLIADESDCAALCAALADLKGATP
jgi:glycosyltransferase involved in cell wall biosynthesis